MQHANNLHWLHRRVVHDEIGENGPEFYRVRSQILPNVTGLRILGHKADSCPQLTHDVPSHTNASVFEKVAPNDIEISFSLWREDERLHLWPLRSSVSNSASILSKTSSPSIPSPRRSEARPS